MQDYVEAFYFLTRFRKHSMGALMPIEFGEIKGYLDEYNVHDRDMRDRYFHHIPVIDNVYRLHMAKKTEEPKKLGKQDKPANI